MRPHRLIVAAVLLLLTGGPLTHAENEDPLRYPQRLPRVEPLTPAQPLRTAPSRAPSAARRTASDSAGLREPVTKKRDTAAAIVVFGDSLADLTAQGLEDAFSERPDVVVLRRTRSDSGLVRSDFYDWPKAVKDYLASKEPIALGVMMIGVNDRQSLKEGGASYEPLSEKWRELYTARIDAIAQRFKERNIPLVWIGAPPMKNERLSADLIVLNDLFRDRVQRFGGSYIDIWEAFIDDENGYVPSGPDLSGQIVRLRTSDGVHFTKAGARKAAHFTEGEIKRLLEAGTAQPLLPEPPPLVSLPDEKTAEAALIPKSLPPPPLRPLAGPVLPLTRTERALDGVLLQAKVKPKSDIAEWAQLVFDTGLDLKAQPGRIDDHRWPKP